MNPDLILGQVCGVILIVTLPVIGFTFYLGILAIKNKWSLRLVLGIPLSVATFAIFLFVWLIDRKIFYLIFGTILGFVNLFSGYYFPSIVIENLNTLLSKYARNKIQEE